MGEEGPIPNIHETIPSPPPSPQVPGGVLVEHSLLECPVGHLDKAVGPSRHLRDRRWTAQAIDQVIERIVGELERRRAPEKRLRRGGRLASYAMASHAHTG